MKPGAQYRFRLYVVGDAQNSVQAISNLTALCRTHLLGHYAIEIVDVLKEPRRALTDGVFLTPTLIKLGPSPARRIIGTLSHAQPVLDALGLGALA